MSDALLILLSAAGGAALGVLFYGGLWLTVRALADSRSPWLLTLASLVARMAVVVGVFVPAVRSGGWQPAVGLLAGLIAARVLLVRVLGRPGLNDRNGGRRNG